VSNTGKSSVPEYNDVTHRVIAIAMTRTQRKKMGEADEKNKTS